MVFNLEWVNFAIWVYEFRFHVKAWAPVIPSSLQVFLKHWVIKWRVDGRGVVIIKSLWFFYCGRLVTFLFLRIIENVSLKVFWKYCWGLHSSSFKLFTCHLYFILNCFLNVSNFCSFSYSFIFKFELLQFSTLLIYCLCIFTDNLCFLFFILRLKCRTLT